MCRLLAWVAPQPVPVIEALGRSELEGFADLSRQHCDGWGMAWWDETSASRSGAPLVERSVECAARDPRFGGLATSAAGDAGFFHLRWATPGLGIAPANTHPFVQGRMAFAHNGAIHPQRRLHEIVSPGWAEQLTGSTDSERYFVAIAEMLAAGAGMEAAIAAVVQRLLRDFLPTSLNATLLTPDALFVVSANVPERGPSFRESSGGDNSSDATDLDFYALRYRVRDDSVVVASSGFHQPDEDAWRALDNMTLLRVERATLAATQTPLVA